MISTSRAGTHFSHAPGKAIRAARLFAPHGRSVFVPMDHSVTIGPIGRGRSTSELVTSFADAGVDAVILHKGRVRTVDPSAFAHIGLVVHLSAGTNKHADPDSKVTVGTVEDALRYGADALSVHVNVGSTNEPDQLRELSLVAQECDNLGIPLMAMMYARRPAQPEDTTPPILAHLASIAIDLGADIVKLSYPGGVAQLRDVTEACDIPVFIAGGGTKPTPEQNRALADDVFAAGAAGLSFGRSVFEADDPCQVARVLVTSALQAGTTPIPVPGEHEVLTALDSLENHPIQNGVAV